MAFQTPMSALGLPQSRPRVRDISMSTKEAALFRRRRTIVGVAVTALCLCVMMTWRLFMQLPPSASPVAVASPRRTLHQTLSPVAEQQQRLKQEEKLAAERQQSVKNRQETSGFHDDKQIVVVLSHFRDSEACAQTLADARAASFLAPRVHFRVFEELYLSREQTCVQRYCELQPKDCKTLLRSGQLRTQRRDASGARGATVARYVAEGMVERKFANDFYLSVDPAVVVFSENWCDEPNTPVR